MLDDPTTDLDQLVGAGEVRATTYVISVTPLLVSGGRW
jgi:hypothetical protein